MNISEITPEIPQIGPMRLQVRKHALIREISTKPTRRWWRTVVPATGLAAAVAVGAMLWTPTNPSAYASWSAEPRAPGADAAAIADECKAQWAAWLTTKPDGAAPAIPSRAMPTETALVDQRGTITLIVLTGQDTMATCLHSPEISMYGLNEVWPGAGTFRTSAISGGESARVLTGRVESGVKRVRVDTTDGKQVTATVSNDWVAAWWPSSAGASLVTMYDEAGNVLGTKVPDNR